MATKKKYALQIFTISGSYMDYTNSETKADKLFKKVNNIYKVKVYKNPEMELLKIII